MMFTKMEIAYIITIVTLIVFGFLFAHQEPSPIETKSLNSPNQIFFVKKDINNTPTIFNKRDDLNISIDIGDDINTTIKTPVVIKAEINSTNNDYIYLWKEGDNILGEGLTLQKSFELGEHLIKVVVLDLNTDKVVGENEILVTAWKYIKKELLYFDEDDGEYHVYNTNFFDHLNRLVMQLSSYDAKELTYNENGKIAQEHYQLFDDSYEYGYFINYSYDGENLLSMEKVDEGGNIIESHLYEDGKEIFEEEADIENNIYYGYEPEEDESKKLIKVYNKDGNLTHIETQDGLYIKNYKYKNGRIVYQESIYPEGKNSFSYEYDSLGNEIKKEFMRYDTKGEILSKTTTSKEYDENGKITRQERIYSLDNVPLQHLITKWKYENNKVKVEETKALIGFCPCTDNIVEDRVIYNYDKNGTEISYDYEYKREGDTQFQKSKDDKLVISYTNVLK